MSSVAKSRVIELTKQLKKANQSNDTTQTITILESLDTIEITTKLLKESGIGKLVNQITKTNTNTTTEIYKLSKALYTKWKAVVAKHIENKKLLQKSNGSTSNEKKIKNKKKLKLKINPNSHKNNKNNNINNNNKNGHNNSDEGEADYDLNRNNKIKQNTIDRHYDWQTGDKMRDKIITKFIEVLKPEIDQKDYLNYIYLASSLENELCLLYESKSQKYKQQYRDLHFNFKKNKNLKLGALENGYSAKQLAMMSAKDMASKKLKQKRQDQQKYVLEEVRSDLQMLASQAMTDEYKCGKCKSRKCKYSQAQTRSADEPMTTFVSCLNCKNRWKC